MSLPLGFRRYLAVTTAMAMVLPAVPAAAQDASDGKAPPARVGEISGVTGPVSFNGAGTGGWTAASLNEPVFAGDSLYTQPGAQAAVAVDESVITLAENTELQVTGLTEDRFGATAAQGEVFLDVDALQPGASFVVATPRGLVTIAQDGKYDIETGDGSSPTVVNVFYGAATVSAPGATLQVAAGQQAVLSGAGQTEASLGVAQANDFARAELARSEEPPPPYVPPVVDEMTGTYQLAGYGSWDQDTDYWAVWYPNVGPDWAPYREGRWANVPPWGWTWIDDEPWGFAPFHYGRWIDRGGRWGWVPAAYGVDAAPVYAPALVSFFGLGVGLAAVGWVPLGPGEAFRPYYPASIGYDRRLNALNVRNVGGIDFNNRPAFDPDHFADHRGATFIGADAMGRGETVARAGRAVQPGMFAQARPAGSDFRLPGPTAPRHPAEAPHLGDFAHVHQAPPAFGGTAPGEARPALTPPESRPAFGVNQGYRAPPAPPGINEPRVFTPGQPGGEAFHPNEAPRPDLPRVIHPDDQGNPFRPQPGMPSRPVAPAFQPPPAEYHPPAMQPMQPMHFNAPPAPQPEPPAHVEPQRANRPPPQ